MTQSSRFDTKLSVTIDGAGISKPIILWVNDGLMAVFFFLIGLELKREVLEGKLRNPRDVLLPGFAALGGMAVPALIFVGFNWNNPATLDGWAIPAATDIAFAVGVLALLGKRAPELPGAVSRWSPTRCARWRRRPWLRPPTSAASLATSGNRRRAWTS